MIRTRLPLLLWGLLMIVAPSALLSWTSWGPAWSPSRIPVPMWANPDVAPPCSQPWQAGVRGARSWNLVPTSYFSFSRGGFNSRGAPVQDGVNEVIFGDTGGALGVTYLIDGPFIRRELDVIIEINVNWNCGPGPTGFTKYDLESVFCHELGHVAGLGHSSVQASTMYYALGAGDDSKRTLHQDDIDGISALYPTTLGVALADKGEDWLSPEDLAGLERGAPAALAGATPLPRATLLGANYPNPFNPSTTIPFSLGAESQGHILLQIFNLRGQLVRTLVDASLPTGSDQAHWDGMDDRGSSAPSGTYLYRLIAGSEKITRRMALGR